MLRTTTFLTLLISLFLNPSKLFSQHASVTLSNEFKITEGAYKDQTVTHSLYYHNSFYTVTNSGASAGKWLFTKLYDIKFSVTVSRFDKNMNTVKEMVLENGAKDFGPLLPQLLCFNDKLYLAFFKSSDKTSLTLYLAAIDENDLTMTEPKNICTIQQKNVGISSIEGVIKSGLVYFAISPDNSRLLVACKSAPNKMQTLILDNTLTSVKQASVNVSLPEFEIPSAVLTADDRACLILTSDQETRILCIGPDGEKTEIRYNASGDLNPYTTRAKLSKDGKSIFIYSTTTHTGQSGTWCNGFMVSQLAPGNFKLSKPQAYLLTPELIQSISEKGGGLKQRREYVMFNFTPQLLELDNGDIAILGSPEYSDADVVESTPNMLNQTHMTAISTLTAGPVIAFFPDKNGKTFDQVIIPRKIVLTKSQSSGSGAIQIVQAPQMSDVTAGFIATRLGEDIIIIYNDNISNLSKSEDEKPKASKSTGELELAEALINKDKKLAYRKLISENKQGRATFYLGNSIPTYSPLIVFPIGKGAVGFNDPRKQTFTNWCFLDIK